MTIHTHSAIVAAMLHAQRTGRKVDDRAMQCSLLAYGFNQFWSEALNGRKTKGYDRFVMLHADVQPLVPDWLEILLGILDKRKLDVVSAVVPIKTQMNDETSTAGEKIGEAPRHRLTMTEIEKFPRTFDNEWFEKEFGERLLINTGCMAIRLNADWCEDFFFSIQEFMVKQDDGTLAPFCVPEDWNFSHFMAEKKIRYAATTEVPIRHWGQAAYVCDFRK